MLFRITKSVSLVAKISSGSPLSRRIQCTFSVSSAVSGRKAFARSSANLASLSSSNSLFIASSSLIYDRLHPAQSSKFSVYFPNPSTLKYYPNFSMLVESWRNYELSLHQFLGESTARVNPFFISHNFVSLI